MPARERRKGVVGEREVAAIWKAHGFDVRGLEKQGDHHVVILRNQLYVAGVGDVRAVRLHCEVKRQERIRLAWIDQAESEAPAGAVPVVAWRRSRGTWYAMLPLNDLARLLA